MGRDDKSKGYLRNIASLTTDRRTEWCSNRQKFFLENKHNQKLLQQIETAQFVMSVDGDLNWGVETTEQLSKYMKDMLAGSGSNRWVDKTMNYAVDASGRAGATGEHSPCDGAELDHLCENVLNVDKQVLVSPSTEEQLEIIKMTFTEKNSLRLAQKLDFQEVDGVSLLKTVDTCGSGVRGNRKFSIISVCASIGGSRGFRAWCPFETCLTLSVSYSNKSRSQEDLSAPKWNTYFW